MNNNIGKYVASRDITKNHKSRFCLFSIGYNNNNVTYMYIDKFYTLLLFFNPFKNIFDDILYSLSDKIQNAQTEVTIYLYTKTYIAIPTNGNNCNNFLIFLLMAKKR